MLFPKFQIRMTVHLSTTKSKDLPELTNRLFMQIVILYMSSIIQFLVVFFRIRALYAMIIIANDRAFLKLIGYTRKYILSYFVYFCKQTNQKKYIILQVI